MPPLNNQSTKTLQIGGLCIVQTAAVVSYRSMQGKEKFLRRLFPQLCQHRGGVNYVWSEFGATTETHLLTPQQPGDQCHYTNQSQAETTIQRYSGGGIVGANKIPTKEGTDGRLYPYNPRFPKYLRKFPVGFGGCFKCGDPSHYWRNECPRGCDNSPDVADIFWRELKIYKTYFENKQRGHGNKGVS